MLFAKNFEPTQKSASQGLDDLQCAAAYSAFPSFSIPSAMAVSSGEADTSPPRVLTNASFYDSRSCSKFNGVEYLSNDRYQILEGFKWRKPS